MAVKLNGKSCLHIIKHCSGSSNGPADRKKPSHRLGNMIRCTMESQKRSLAINIQSVCADKQAQNLVP